MSMNNVIIQSPWVYGGDQPKTDAMKFFEAYAQAVESRTFGDEITKWYGDSTVYRSETGKIFYGAEEMRQWMTALFFKFESLDHLPEHYLELPESDKTVKVQASFRRRLWLKGNTGAEPDIDTPMAWMCHIGPAKGGNGHLGLHFHDVQLYWDKTKTVELLGVALPSDKRA